jgi:sulfane dehydrogenase subunit SoxC
MEPITTPVVGNGTGIENSELIHREELQLAFRNNAIPLEALRYDITPIGLHYTLIHYDIPFVDPPNWQLEMGGAVRTRARYSLADLQQRPPRTLRVTLECAGDGRALLQPRPISQPWLTGAVGTADWTGTPLRPLLEEAGVGDDVIGFVFTGADHGIEGGVEQDYQRSLPRKEAMHGDALLAWSMNGRPLEPQHGFPLRLIIPGWYGMAHVKWLRSIEAVTAPFVGYQDAVAYRYSASRQESGDAVTLMRVRSLMVPPGFPDFLTRARIVRRGVVDLVGRAWSGRSPIRSVNVSADGGETWEAATLEPQQESSYSWQRWSYRWDASTRGRYELCCRATDEAGEAQPTAQNWTARGMGNNMVQRVSVQVI